ncbi:MAG: alpha/beta hydrolase [Anaerolineales bacterium]
MDKYYRKVPPAHLEQLRRFRKEHPLRNVTIDSVKWEYLTAGNPSGEPLLLLPGALSTAESAWRTITSLEDGQYRLIVPSYPPEVDSMSTLADGLVEILTREGIQSTYVMGGSYGGMLAQVFTHKHPGMVSKLVLSHTYPPESRRANSVTPALRLFKRLPMFMVKKMLRDRMTGILPPKASPELLLIAAQIRETVDTHLTRQAAINTYLRMMDFDRQTYTPDDLANWPGKTLIMLAEDDPTTPESLRNELIGLYPGATVHLFKDSDRRIGILESSEYVSVMEEFFKE